MLTRDEVVQLILYLVVATVLLLASRARVGAIEHVTGSAGRSTEPIVTSSARDA